MFVIIDADATPVHYLSQNFPSGRRHFTRHLENATEYNTEQEANTEAEMLRTNDVWMAQFGRPTLSVVLIIHQYPDFVQ